MYYTGVVPLSTGRLIVMAAMLQFKYLKWAAILLLVFTIVLLGAVAGLVAGEALCPLRSRPHMCMHDGICTLCETRSAGAQLTLLLVLAASTKLRNG